MYYTNMNRPSRLPLKPVAIALLAVLVLGSSASAKTKASKSVPNEAPKVATSSGITIDAKNIAAGRSKGGEEAVNAKSVRVTTTHTQVVEIVTRNLGTQTEKVTLHWFWVGRYSSSGNWFRKADGEKTFDLDPNKMETVEAVCGEAEEHVTKNKKGSTYKSGGNMLGWVVAAYNSKKEIVSVKVSEPYLQNFAAEPPAKARKS